MLVFASPPIWVRSVWWWVCLFVSPLAYLGNHHGSYPQTNPWWGPSVPPSVVSLSNSPTDETKGTQQCCYPSVRRPSVRSCTSIRLLRFLVKSRAIRWLHQSTHCLHNLLPSVKALEYSFVIVRLTLSLSANISCLKCPLLTGACLVTCMHYINFPFVYFSILYLSIFCVVLVLFTHVWCVYQ